MAHSKPLMAQSSGTDANAAVQSALRTLDAGVSGVSAIGAALQGPLGPAFAATIDLIREAKGRTDGADAADPGIERAQGRLNGGVRIFPG